jgi:outer membrane protein
MPLVPALPSHAQRPAFVRIARAVSVLGTGSGSGRHGNIAVTSATAMQALLAAAFLALCPHVRAQSVAQEPAYGLSGRIGLVVATVPTYEGSPNRRTLAGPDLTLSYRSREWGTVEFGQRGLFWNAVEAGRFRFALVAQFDPGRKDKDTSTLNPTPGDKRLAGMGKVSTSTEAGVGIGYGPVMLVARQSLSDRGPKGAQADLTVEMPWALSDHLGLRFAVGATWANRDYMQTYFGVTPAQAQATSFSVYTPKSGCRKVEASVGAEYVMASNWKLHANVGFTQLGDFAAASPLVGRRNSASAAVGVALEF